MKPALTILSGEHKNILIVIDALLNECRSIEDGQPINEDFFNKTVDFIRNYADRFHHAKEEDILFAELAKDNVQMHCNPVPQMLHEHEIGREFVAALTNGIKDQDKFIVLQSARGYAQLLQEHIYKEDNILYPMADEALSPGSKEAMLAKFKTVDEEYAGELKKQLQFVAELKKVKA